MDPASIAAGLTMARMGQTQQALAGKMMKMNAEAAQSVVTMLEASQQNIEQLTAGMGANVDIRA